MTIFKSIQQHHSLLKQQGQALVEYLLTLIVTVGIIIGILYQFSTAFQVFASNYFGKYTKCLIQEGELPKLDVKEEDKIPSICQKSFKPFTFNEGRPPVDRTSSTTSSSRASNNAGGSSRFTDGKPGSSLNRGNNDRGSNANSANNQSGDSDNKKNKNGSGQIHVQGSGSATGFKGIKVKNKKDQLSKNRSNASVVGKISVKKSKKKKKKKKVKANSKNSNDENAKVNKKSFRMTATKKKQEVKDSSGQWDFSDYIRYLIIAAIVLVLIFIIGSQLLIARKSQD